jgi:hypothetical protein
VTADEDRRVDALYGLPLDEFTAARDELAKDLRQEGEREAASRVKGLRKPTAAAWLANQLARTQKKEAERLLDASEQVRAAQARLLQRRGSPDDLRAATEQQNQAVRELVARASGFLDREGKSPSRSTLDKVEETLRALAGDAETSAAFAAGWLTKEARASGFPLAGPPATQRPKRGPSEDRARAREALKQARAEQRERRREVIAAERVVRRARQEAERADRRLKEAADALERAQAREADAATRIADAETHLRRDS